MLTHRPLPLQAVGADEPEPEHGSKEPLPTPYPGHPQQHAGQTQPPTREGNFDTLSVIIRRGHPNPNSQPEPRYVSQRGARMGNCGICGESNEAGACNRCGAPVGRYTAPCVLEGMRNLDVRAAAGERRSSSTRETDAPAPDWPL